MFFYIMGRRLFKSLRCPMSASFEVSLAAVLGMWYYNALAYIASGNASCCVLHAILFQCPATFNAVMIASHSMLFIVLWWSMLESRVAVGVIRLLTFLPLVSC